MASDLKRRLGSYPTVDREPYYEVLQKNGSVKIERYQVAKKHPSRIIRQVRENPLPNWAWYAALTAGAAAIVGVTYAVTKSSVAPAAGASPPAPTLPPVPPPPLNRVNSGSSLTVSPGITVQTVALNVQDPVIIHLPLDAQWVSMDGAPVHDATSPITFTFLGPISHTLVWNDSRGLQYISSYFFVVDPRTVPTTNA